LPEKYPDVLPNIKLEDVEYDDDIQKMLMAECKNVAEACIGMAMIFTIVNTLQVLVGHFLILFNFGIVV
jgi:hypothetical protein